MIKNLILSKLILVSIILLPTSVFADANKGFEGFYLGIQLGAVEGITKHKDNNDWWSSDYRSEERTKKSSSLGLKLGYDKLEGSLLYGVLGEGSILSLNTEKEFLTSYTVGSKINALGSVRAKAGIISDKLSVFGTGGLALANIKDKYFDNGTYKYNEDGRNYGYVVGLGASYLITDNRSIELDVSRYVFGKKNHESTSDDVGAPYSFYFEQSNVINSVNVSYNIKF
jgi:outer membrane immunogenic protein